MFGRVPIAFLILLLSFPQAGAKSKKKQVLPEYVLRAQTVAVVIDPEAGEPVTSPKANRIAETKVEEAITRWGRFKVISNAQAADLIIAVRTGHSHGPTIRNSPADQRAPNDEIGNIPDASQQGRSPDLTHRLPSTVDDRRPHISTNEMRSPEDSFEVYRGRVDYPLDASAVWRYQAKDALDGFPEVVAVEQFKKAIKEAEQQSQQKP